MSTVKNNGCTPGDRKYKVGADVKVMPRQMAVITARRNNLPIGAMFTVSDEAKLKANNYVGRIAYRRVQGGVQQVRLTVPEHGVTAYIPVFCLFGINHQLGDVVEVGMTTKPGVPPTRRLFLGYAFDHRFDATVMVYGERDTQRILDDMNTAVVDLEDAEIWTTCYPEEKYLNPKEPEYDVSIAKNGSPISVREMGRAEWCAIYDKANA